MKHKRIENMPGRTAGREAGKGRKAMRGKTGVKATAAALCAVLVLGGAGTGIDALAAEKNRTQETETDADKAPGKNGGTGETKSKGADAPQGRPAKEETVYVWTHADGSAREVVVSDWLRNETKVSDIEDVSELSDIENVGGDESFIEKAGNVKVWEAGGGDIYYQGRTDKELPVSLKITYFLDGKEITPKELAGKSGRVTIRFSYINEQYEYAEIDGSRTKVYVPFAVVTGMILDNEVFTNVKVSNGRLINDGDRYLVVGYGLPGLRENLDSDKLDLPDYFEITGDAENFEMGMTVTIAANEPFNGVDLDGENPADDLHRALGELTDAMEQLMDGSSQLYDGLCTLSDQSGVLIQGIDRLSAGASELQSGVGALDDGAGRLQSGAANLQAGLSTLVSKNGELNGGARQVFDTLLAAARTQLGAAGLDVPGMTVENYGDVLNGVIASLDTDAVYQKAYEQVSAAVEAKRGEIEAAVTAAVREQAALGVTAAVRQGAEEKAAAAVREKVTEAVLGQLTPPMTKADYDAAVAAGMISQEEQDRIAAAVDGEMASDAVRTQIADTVEARMGTAEVQALIEAETDKQMAEEGIRETIAANTEQQVQKAIADNMAGEDVQSKLAAASEGAKAVIALKQSLDSYNVFYLGVQAYTAGVAQAADGAGRLKGGADELRDGTGKLYAGASELSGGILAMKNSTPALTEGITQLRDGAQQLSEGLVRFNDQGIQKLADALDDDLDGLVERLRATLDASRRYNNFSGLDSRMDGQVKFIYRTDSIEAEE